MSSIIVFGSLNADLVFSVPQIPQAGETVIGPSWRVVPGGKGGNQAVAAARAGAHTAFHGRVGADDFGALLLDSLGGAGVDTSGVVRGTEPTGCAAILVDAAGRNAIAVAGGANLAASATAVPQTAFAPGDLLLLQMEVPVAENWHLAKRAKAAGVRVLLNVAPAADVPRASLNLIDIVVMNEHEALTVARHLGIQTEDPVAAGLEIARLGPDVVVTLGAEGAVAFPAGDVAGWRIGTLDVAVVDTTAAGDAFIGAFAAALSHGEQMPDALRHGAVAGALACTVAGAAPSLPDKAAIEAGLARLPEAILLS